MPVIEDLFTIVIVTDPYEVTVKILGVPGTAEPPPVIVAVLADEIADTVASPATWSIYTPIPNATSWVFGPELEGKRLWSRRTPVNVASLLIVTWCSNPSWSVKTVSDARVKAAEPMPAYRRVVKAGNRSVGPPPQQPDRINRRAVLPRRSIRGWP
jgi:hypothetical protein